MIKRVSSHVPTTPSTFSAGYNRTANHKPYRWVVIGNITTFDATLDTFRNKRKELISLAHKEDVRKLNIVKHSIWPRSYGYEYIIHLVEGELQ